MILLDTNVISELMKSEPRSSVREWLNRQAGEEVWTSTLTLYEVRWGIERLPPSRRRDLLEVNLEALVRVDIRNRIALLDEAASYRAAALQAQRVKAGTVKDLADTLIAGIALSRRATIATRNVFHFDDLDVPVIDPWSA